MGWLIALGVLIGLAILPLGVSAIYDAGGAVAYLLLGPVRLKLYPGKKKEKKAKKPSTGPARKKAATADAKKTGQGGTYKDFLPIVKTMLELLCKFRSKLRVKRLELKLILASDDPGDLAVNYGRAWASLGNLMPQLERFFIIKKRNLEVECDFTSDQTLIFARLDLTITLGRLLSLGGRYGFRILRQYLDIMKLRKGGAKT